MQERFPELGTCARALGTQRPRRALVQEPFSEVGTWAGTLFRAGHLCRNPLLRWAPVPGRSKHDLATRIPTRNAFPDVGHSRRNVLLSWALGSCVDQFLTILTLQGGHLRPCNVRILTLSLRGQDLCKPTSLLRKQFM